MAANLAQSGATDPASLLCVGGAISVFIVAGRKTLYVGDLVSILQGFRDDILPARPLSKINQPATLAAEREVGPGASDRLLADGTLQLNLLFAGHNSIVDGKKQSYAYIP